MTVYPPNGGFSFVFAFYFYIAMRVNYEDLIIDESSTESFVYVSTPFEEFISRVAISLFFMGF